MMRIARLVRIHLVALRFGLDEFLLGHERVRGLRPFVNRVLFWRDLSQPRGVRLREALQALGPIFVKFGQMLSTRRDLLPPDISDELGEVAGSRAAVSGRAGRWPRLRVHMASRSTRCSSRST